MFWIAGKRDLPTWEWLVRLVRHWDAIEQEIIDSGEGPWFRAVNEHGLSVIDV